MSNSPIDILFPAVCGKPVECRFDGGDVTSDAGFLLLREADRRMGLVDEFADCIRDRRQRGKVSHTVAEMVRARVLAIACGYEDANDLDTLGSDPALKIACERLPETDGSLASQPTISRLENAVRRADLYRMGVALAERVVAQLPSETKRVILDVDATDDPCHGQQQLEGFNGYYDEHCYLPFGVWVTDEGGRMRLLASLLRPGKAGATLGLFGVLRRAVALLRQRFPDVQITLRGDSAYGVADVIAFCEKQNLHYVLGLRSNNRLQALSTPAQLRACLRWREEGDGCREFDEFLYKAGTWAGRRRVIVKAEITRGDLNPRYVVTNRHEETPEQVYAFYCRRGECENRIKELKLDMQSGRTSCHRFLANQFRLLLHSAACVLMGVVQAALSGTCLDRAQAGTVRLRLLKIGARVVQTCRRIWLHLPTSCPVRDLWRQVAENLAITAT
jgi:hypothetical protein